MCTDLTHTLTLTRSLRPSVDIISDFGLVWQPEICVVCEMPFEFPYSGMFLAWLRLQYHLVCVPQPHKGSQKKAKIPPAAGKRPVATNILFSRITQWSNVTNQFRIFVSVSPMQEHSFIRRYEVLEVDVAGWFQTVMDRTESPRSSQCYSHQHQLHSLFSR